MQEAIVCHFRKRSFPVGNYRYVISLPDANPQAESKHDREEDHMETNWGETHAELTKKIKYLAVDTVRYFSSLVKKEAGEGRPTFHRGYDSMSLT